MPGKTKLAAQLYTLREFMKTPADMAQTLKKVREIGYQAVQLSGHGPIEAAELKKMLDQEKLTVCATHVSFEQMRDAPEQVIANHKTWNCTFTAVGSIPKALRNEAGYHSFAKDASAAARRLKQDGLSFGYHNHGFEFEKFGGKTGLEILYAESDPEVFGAELDTYWIVSGGGDPAQWIRNLKTRISHMHFKDMAIKDGQQIRAEVGEGNLNWPEILKACKAAKVQWYIVEQDVCQRDPFESLAISLRNLQSWGLK